MIKNRFLFGVVPLLLSSCGGQPTLPEGILPDTVMRNILTDISIADAAANVSMGHPNMPRFRSETFYEPILEKHGVTRDRFLESLDFYTNNPKRLAAVYEDVLTEISKRQVEENK